MQPPGLNLVRPTRVAQHLVLCQTQLVDDQVCNTHPPEIEVQGLTRKISIPTDEIIQWNPGLLVSGAVGGRFSPIEELGLGFGLDSSCELRSGH